MVDSTGQGTEAMGDDVLARAQAALTSGRPALARDLLEDHVGDHRDPEAFKMLAEVRHRLGDVAGAGAAWFATSAKGPVVDDAVAQWRQAHQDDFGAMWASIPESAKHGELTPKLAALKAKAGVGDGDASRAEADVEPFMAAEPEREPRRDERKSREDAAAGATSGQPPAAPAAESEARRQSPAERPSGLPADRPTDRPGERSAREKSTPAREASAAPHTDEGATDASVPDAKTGFDAAKVIAWVLAALFVVCAVVGLVTILQWLVPGS